MQHGSHFHRVLKILPRASKERKCDETVVGFFEFRDYCDDGKTPGKLWKCGKMCNPLTPFRGALAFLMLIFGKQLP